MERIKSNHSFKVCDLTYLSNFAGGDLDFMKQMIQLFFLQVPAELNNLRQQASIKNLGEVSKTAHKLKSSVSLLGAESMKTLLKEIESLSGKEEDSAQILQLHDELLQLYKAAHEELKAYLAGY